MDATANINPASRGLRYDGPKALATIPEESSSDSVDPDLRHDVFPDDGHGYCPRDELPARCGPIDGAARWERGEDPRADDRS